MHIKAERILGGALTGALNGAGLQALLTADAGYVSALRLGILGNAPRRDAMLASTSGVAALAGSVLAMQQVWATPGVPDLVAANSAWVSALAASDAQMQQAYQTPAAVASLFGASRKLILAPYAAQITLATLEVAEWRDASGNGINFANASAGQRPSYNGVALNGITTLAFDGANDRLQRNGNMFAAGDYTFYIVARRATGTNDRALIADGTAGWIGSNGTSMISSNSTGAGSALSGQSVTQDTWFLQRVRKLSTNIFGKLNGNAESAALPTQYPAFTSVLEIGHQNGTKFYAGSIAEIVALGKSAADGDADDARITSILRTKYNLW